MFARIFRQETGVNDCYPHPGRLGREVPRPSFLQFDCDLRFLPADGDRSLRPPLQAFVPIDRPIEIQGCADQREVGQRLRKIADQLGARAKLFRIELDVVAVGDQLFKISSRLFDATGVFTTGTWNLTGGILDGDTEAVQPNGFLIAWAWLSGNGIEYGQQRISYMSPSFFGFDFAVDFLLVFSLDISPLLMVSLGAAAP